MLPNGPPDGRPGFGSQVSNWLGAPHSQRRMTFFSAFFAAAAKAGFVNKPLKLVTAAAPDAARPLRNSRRCSRCSLGVQQPGSAVFRVIGRSIFEQQLARLAPSVCHGRLGRVL